MPRKRITQKQKTCKITQPFIYKECITTNFEYQNGIYHINISYHRPLRGVVFIDEYNFWKKTMSANITYKCFSCKNEFKANSGGLKLAGEPEYYCPICVEEKRHIDTIEAYYSAYNRPNWAVEQEIKNMTEC